MGYYFWGIDITYIILVIPAAIFAMIAQAHVSSAFNRFSQVHNTNGMTGAQVAERLLRNFGIHDVRIESANGKLTDHFDPKMNVIRLSEGVYNSSSVAAAGIAAHECGHAMQYAEAYGPIKLRAAIIPISQLGSSMAIPLIFLGFLFNMQPLVSVGIIFFGAAVVFQLVTLPVEFNASARALKTLESTGCLSIKEVPMAKKVLSAAAMTYVAALAVSLAQFLRLILLFGNRDRD